MKVLLQLITLYRYFIPSNDERIFSIELRQSNVTELETFYDTGGIQNYVSALYIEHFRISNKRSNCTAEISLFPSLLDKKMQTYIKILTKSNQKALVTLFWVYFSSKSREVALWQWTAFSLTLSYSILVYQQLTKEVCIDHI